MNHTPADKVIDKKILAALKEYYSESFNTGIPNYCTVHEESHSVVLPTYIPFGKDNVIQFNYIFDTVNDTVKIYTKTGHFAKFPLDPVIDSINRYNDFMHFKSSVSPRSFEIDGPPAYDVCGTSEAFYNDPDEIINCLERILDEVYAIVDNYKVLVLSEVKGEYSMEDFNANMEDSLARIHRLLFESKIDAQSFWEGCKANYPYVQETPITDDRISVTLRCGMYSLPVGTYAQDDIEAKEFFAQSARDMCFAIEEVMLEGMV